MDKYSTEKVMSILIKHEYSSVECYYKYIWKNKTSFFIPLFTTPKIPNSYYFYQTDTFIEITKNDTSLPSEAPGVGGLDNTVAIPAMAEFYEREINNEDNHQQLSQAQREFDDDMQGSLQNNEEQELFFYIYLL